LLCAVAAIGSWFETQWLASDPGSSEDIFKRLQVGMTQREAVTVIRTYNPYTVEGLYSEGTTTDGQSFSSVRFRLPFFDDLPPPHQIKSCLLSVCANDGRDLDIVLGPGGIVSAKSISPGVWEHRVDRVLDTLDRARTDLLSGLWWRDQLRKSYHSIRVRIFLAAVLLLASVWIIRRRASLRRKVFQPSSAMVVLAARAVQKRPHTTSMRSSSTKEGRLSWK
jgi:hypothetical protein